ncbi:hypothetical protein RF11_02010 [Thelohanellus kitauei]|uniref:Uncharacterized protein n=1 Tax=Thelohanellus kitauei TaxID=669202 RepID=A0A0C2IRE7_THEKT|nr:hypothetical protein RF11_02010 [Thelohanellus kitauei]
MIIVENFGSVQKLRKTRTLRWDIWPPNSIKTSSEDNPEWIFNLSRLYEEEINNCENCRLRRARQITLYAIQGAQKTSLFIYYLLVNSCRFRENPNPGIKSIQKKVATDINFKIEETKNRQYTSGTKHLAERSDCGFSKNGKYDPRDNKLKHDIDKYQTVGAVEGSEILRPTSPTKIKMENKHTFQHPFIEQTCFLSDANFSFNNNPMQTIKSTYLASYSMDLLTSIYMLSSLIKQEDCKGWVRESHTCQDPSKV